MSIRDYSKQYNLKNMTTGELFCTIDDNEFDGTDESYINCMNVSVPVGDVRLLNAIHECFENNHGCLISIGYKA